LLICLSSTILLGILYFSTINLGHLSHCLFFIIPRQFLHNQIVRRHGIGDEFFTNVILASELYGNNCIINYKGCLNIFCEKNNNRIKYRIFFLCIMTCIDYTRYYILLPISLASIHGLRLYKNNKSPPTSFG